MTPDTSRPHDDTRLSGEDLTFWWADSPTQPTTMAMLLVLDRMPDWNRLRHAVDVNMPRGFSDHPKPEYAHRCTFEQGGSCSPSQSQAEHGDTYGVIEAVTEEVERVSVQAH